jgi:cyanophycin synthetase
MNWLPRTNADPRRGVGHEKVLTRIKIDQTAIDLVAAQGFGMDDVPAEGSTVKLTLTGNMSTGGISIDRTFEAHPENIEIAEEAAQVVGLDIAGIDFIAPDITQPVRETGGAICEVNAAPGFRMHTHPAIGDPQYVAKPVIDMLFPPGMPSRIPIVAVTGTNGKTTTARMIAHIFKGIGKKVGMTSTDGVVIDERLVIRSDASGPRSAKMVLQNPRVDFAVFEVARGGILREGLGYERNDVGVVLNVQADHLGCVESTLSSSWQTSRPSLWRRCRVTASPCSTPTTRWSGRCGDDARGGLCGSAWRSPGVRSAIRLMISAAAADERSYWSTAILGT